MEKRKNLPDARWESKFMLTVRIRPDFQIKVISSTRANDCCTTVVRGVNWLLVKRSFVRFVRRTKPRRSWFRPRNDLWQPSRSCGAAGSRGTLCSFVPSYNTISNSFIAFTFSGLFLAHSSRSDYWIRYTAELNWFSPVIARFTTVLYAREHTHGGTG